MPPGQLGPLVNAPTSIHRLKGKGNEGMGILRLQLLKKPWGAESPASPPNRWPKGSDVLVRCAVSQQREPAHFTQPLTEYKITYILCKKEITALQSICRTRPSHRGWVLRHFLSDRVLLSPHRRRRRRKYDD
ncbi:hypothetical protein SKAU_G00202550 [Synaphobranchus kaupii]|uniref:Uncharacterized protein n=1 Tax=Synaphobranchus kaupii TaxID=118154 RepID=A0A9Q1IXZ9_SYNKA|nr:hypothetical protein SKAU_G00202550 [Synaphobranchus kaupii]